MAVNPREAPLIQQSTKVCTCHPALTCALSRTVAS